MAVDDGDARRLDQRPLIGPAMAVVGPALAIARTQHDHRALDFLLPTDTRNPFVNFSCSCFMSPLLVFWRPPRTMGAPEGSTGLGRSGPAARSRASSNHQIHTCAVGGLCACGAMQVRTCRVAASLQVSNRPKAHLRKRP